jgi:uncharacterized protein YprB with RNaseH-like and TPR domain
METMLKNTFVHIPGIGVKSEQKIWFSGIHSWNDLLMGNLSLFTQTKRDILKRSIEESHEQLSQLNPNFFWNRMPSNQYWRIFPEFKESIAYLDIETTGLDAWSNQITTIALYDGSSIFTYIQVYREKTWSSLKKIFRNTKSWSPIMEGVLMFPSLKSILELN